MKIALISFHFVNNFGGLLQAYALQETVKKHCCRNVEIIDYKNAFITLTDFIRLFPMTSNILEIRSGLQTMPDRFGRIRKFKSFLKSHMNVSDRKYNGLNLLTNPPEADIYICGSDQIWNPFLTFGIKGPYFLNFVRGKRKRVAYAPSFGNSSLPSIFHSRVKKYLEKFDAISVREKTGIQIAEDLTGKKADMLIDPTFLLEREDWEKIALDPKICGPYMLLYIMQSDDRMFAYARKLKERLGIPVVEISRYGYHPDFVDQTLVNVGPREFLGLFQHASYICTNSYHGFIFSLIFEKPFCLIPSRRFRTRIFNLAEMLSMKIHESTPDIVEDTAYDKELMEKVIHAERDRAIQWLKNNTICSD